MYRSFAHLIHGNDAVAVSIMPTSVSVLHFDVRLLTYSSNLSMALSVLIPDVPFM